jgi:hypothetical protein
MKDKINMETEDKISFHFNGELLYECKFTDYVKAIKKLVEEGA